MTPSAGRASQHKRWGALERCCPPMDRGVRPRLEELGLELWAGKNANAGPYLCRLGPKNWTRRFGRRYLPTCQPHQSVAPDSPYLPAPSLTFKPMAGELQGPAVLGYGPHKRVLRAGRQFRLDLQRHSHLGTSLDREM